MLLDVKSVDKKFNGVYALKGLDFSLGEGEVHGLIGENGAGKSTFIKILGGVYKRDGGSIMWNGKDLPEVIRPEGEPEAGDQHYLSGQRPDSGVHGNGKYLSRKTVPGKRRADPMERDGTGSRGESGGAWDPS